MSGWGILLFDSSHLRLWHNLGPLSTLDSNITTYEITTTLHLSQSLAIKYFCSRKYFPLVAPRYEHLLVVNHTMIECYLSLRVLFGLISTTRGDVIYGFQSNWGSFLSGLANCPLTRDFYCSWSTWAETQLSPAGVQTHSSHISFLPEMDQLLQVISKKKLVLVKNFTENDKIVILWFDSQTMAGWCK